MICLNLALVVELELLVIYPLLNKSFFAKVPLYLVQVYGRMSMYYNVNIVQRMKNEVKLEALDVYV